MMNLNDIKNYYKSQSQKECISLYRTGEILQIVFVRHAKPVISKKAFVTFEEAEEHLENYRNSSVNKDFRSPICVENITDVSIYHSDLTRSKETARHIFPPEIFTHIEDGRFRELDRQNIRLPFKTPYRVHTTLSRIVWLTGSMKQVENPKQALKRLKNNAKYLDQLVQDQKLLIIVAHGFHNHFVGRFLKSLGYTPLHKGGNKHLAVNIWGKQHEIPLN